MEGRDPPRIPVPEPEGYIEGKMIAGLRTPLFVNLYGIWHDYHVLQVLPHGKGTLDERPVVIRWIKRFEAELASMQRWEEN